MIDGRRASAKSSAESDRPGADAGDLGTEPSRSPEEPAPAVPSAESNGLLRGLRRVRLGERLVRCGVTADQVTALGILLAGATGVVIGLGYLWVGVGMVTIGGLMDALDGAVAKAAGTCSKRGAFFDSVADRVADGLIFGGVAWYLATGGHPREALIPFAILGVSALISYERAKAESLGWDAKGGLMERAERLIGLGIALALNVIFVPLLWVLLALTGFTACQRFVKIWRQATLEGLPQEADSVARAGASWRRGRVESRWRTWRQTHTPAPRRWSASSSRTRARRRDEPLGTRLRRVWSGERSTARRRPARSNRFGSGSGTALRRRISAGRQ